MLGALIIVFREVIEAGLIVGIVMAATRGVPGRGRMDQPWHRRRASRRLAGGAVRRRDFAEAFQGAGQELFNACILGIAVLMLMWHNAWMARHGREMAAEMKSIGQLRREQRRTAADGARRRGGRRGAARRFGSGAVSIWDHGDRAHPARRLLVGGLLGAAAGAAFTALTYFGLLAIPTRYIFSVTSWLIALLAAGMASQAVQFLSNAGR